MQDMKLMLKIIKASHQRATKISFDGFSWNFVVYRKVISKAGLEQTKSLQNLGTELMLHSAMSFLQNAVASAEARTRPNHFAAWRKC